MKNGNSEGVGEFDKLLFDLSLGIDSGEVVLLRGEFNTKTLPDYIVSGQPDTKRELIPLKFFSQFSSVFFFVVVAWVLLKPRLYKEHNKDLEQYPLLQWHICQLPNPYILLLTLMVSIYQAYGHTIFPYFPHKAKSTQLVSPFWLN